MTQATSCATLTAMQPEYPLAEIRDRFEPKGQWKRGGRVIGREDRQDQWLRDVRNAFLATMNRIKAGDVEYANLYARHLWHYGVLYLAGIW